MYWTLVTKYRERKKRTRKGLSLQKCKMKIDNVGLCRRIFVPERE